MSSSANDPWGEEGRVISELSPNNTTHDVKEETVQIYRMENDTRTKKEGTIPISMAYRRCWPFVFGLQRQNGHVSDAESVFHEQRMTGRHF